MDSSFTPEPLKCYAGNCEGKLLIAFLLKGKKSFEFACIEHKSIIDTSEVVTFDTIENYNKRKKRRMYDNLIPVTKGKVC
jgi:hypothetical protein